MTAVRSISPAPRNAWLPDGGRDEKPEHRCGLCFGPYGKSAIRCKNEPTQPKWLVKLKRVGFETVMGIRAVKADAETLALALNTEYQTDEYYVEMWKEGDRG